MRTAADRMRLVVVAPDAAGPPGDDDAVVAHLQGRHVMDVYPLLEDDTCCFLAVDFDKGGWAEDVIAFVATARRSGLPIAVECSAREMAPTRGSSFRHRSRPVRLATWAVTT
jgi:hypothetical protein